jgi:Spherulation-specific family 4
MNLLGYSSRRVQVTEGLLFLFNCLVCTLLRNISDDSELADGIIVPLYSYPGPTWQSVIRTKEANPLVPILAVINPANGPGTSPDPNYVESINRLRSVGVTVLGYIHTSYGARLQYAVIADIDAYRRWYDLNGILFDEMSSATGFESYYSSLNEYTKSLGYSLTVGNPGTAVPLSYVGTMDVLCIYENVGLPLLHELFSRTVAHHKSKFASVSIGVGTLDAVFVSAASKYVRWIYVTDANLPNPYNVLPSYFQTLVQGVNKKANIHLSISHSHNGSESQGNEKANSCTAEAPLRFFSQRMLPIWD